MTIPSARYERQSPYGLRIPDYDAAFDLQQTRPISDLSNWIIQVIRFNGQFAQRDKLTGFNQVVTPTRKKVPYLGFRTGFAAYSFAGAPGHVAEIFTLPNDTPGALQSIIRVHESPETDREHMVCVSIHNQSVYNGLDANESSATPLLRPLMQDVLKELGYGTPKSLYADVALLQQPHPEYRLVPSS